ncbi:MAG: isoamylase early set domain-containing protein [Candidatus Methanomethylicaceae archaeon]
MTPTSKKKPKVSQNLKQTKFSLLAPEAKGVSLAGTFNQWDPSTYPMKKDKKGMWKISLPLSPGRYEYRFFVDGEWQTDPNCSTCVENPFGTLNCVRIVE